MFVKSMCREFAMKLTKYECVYTLLSILVFGLSIALVQGEGEDSLGEDDLVQVSTTSGVLEGRYRYTTKNVKFASFENIPFAEPPLGDLRFKDPVPIREWKGIRKATSKGHHCPQMGIFGELAGKIIGNEDCLSLNIYTPRLNPDKLLPVMVHFAGGGLSMSADVMFSNPNSFIEAENVILILVNYRLGALGFLSLGTEDIPGNAGLKDQVAGLRWIKRNIVSFGGNPDLLTAFGESAGGLSASLLQITPMTKGLLNGVISISSAGLNEWAMERDPESRVVQLAKSLGLNPDDEILPEQLRAETAENIIKLAGGLFTETGDFGFPWKVVKENKFDNVEAFLTRWPEEYYELGLFNHIPAIIGYCSHEGAGIFDFIKIALESQSIIPTKKWNLTIGSDLHIEAENRVKQFYLNGREFDLSDKDLLEGTINLFSDVWFFRDIDNTARALAQHSRAPVYYYRFSFKPDVFSGFTKDLDVDGAVHAAEIMYLFGETLEENSRDNLTRRRLLQLFKNFALTGNPTPDKDDPLLQITWPPMTRSVANYLEINDKLTPGTDPDGKRAAFWRELEEYVLQKNSHIREEL